MIEQARKEDTWDIYLAKGAGDRAIAGDHEERHLLELLQNARDAIYRGRLEGDDTAGRVLILVTNHGMAMANTGAPFRLDQEEVLKAVRFLMRSDKAGHGFVGHKGIGLKSILLRAGAFTVRSRIDGETLRATFSRYQTAQYLLNWLDAQDEEDVPCQYIRAELPRMPLFTQPHVDTHSLGRDKDLVEALVNPASRKHLGLNADGIPSSLPHYTTVVYLPYREPEWEDILDTIALTLDENGADKNLRAAFQRAREQTGSLTQNVNADTIWQELMMLDPRVLVLLGEMAEVQIVRFRGRHLMEARRIDIGPPLFPLSGRRDFKLQSVQLHTRHWIREKNNQQDPQHQTFTVLSAPTTLGELEDNNSFADNLGVEGPPESIRILLEVPASDFVSLKNEPLFLYYPIEASQSGLPFLVHGPFRVNSSRTALVPSQQAHNQAVLEQAVTVLERGLPELLKPGHPLRRWLPWILLPFNITDDVVDDGVFSPKARALGQSLVTRLREQHCVPTTKGVCAPQHVHFWPEYPEALTFLEDLRVGRKKMRNYFYLLDQENLETYQLLATRSPERWHRAARAIGLGQIDLETFAQELASQLGGKSADEPLPVNAGQARAFFLSWCALLSSKDRARSRNIAGILGNSGVPLLPALPVNGTEDQEQLLLVLAELRERGGTVLKQAKRVVFWRPASVKARAGDIPAPPSSIPIFFIDPDVIEADEARAEGILSRFYDEWGTTRFESRPDLFRRVADRAAQLKGKNAIPVLSYLAGVLHQILDESFSGAEDLQPHPYAAINLALLRTAIDYTNRSTAQRTQDRQRLDSLQLWGRVQVPVKGHHTRYAQAEYAVFGPSWATLLEQQLPPSADIPDEKEEEERPPEQGWAQAIRAQAAFRKAIGRRPSDTNHPEIADPDDARWQPALTQLKRVLGQASEEEMQGALYRLLLLLGVRIGPRVAWRWLNVGQKEALDTRSHAISLDTSKQIFRGATSSEDIIPPSFAQSGLVRAYCEFIALEPHNPAFAAEHSPGHREHLRRTGEMQSHLAAWMWLPDLEKAALGTMPFKDDLEAVDAFRAALLAVWESLSDTVLKTGWYCAAGWHRGRTWQRTIPSLAAFQISRLALWSARGGGRLTDIDRQRFPAAVMVAWEQEGAPPAAEPAGFFPLLDIHHNPVMAQVARDLGVTGLADVDFAGAVLRLRWLLEKSRQGDIAPSGFWQIAELPGSSRDAWLAAQYRMLDRIVPRDPQRFWDRRTVQTCGLALRAVKDDEQIAVPVVTASDGKLKFATDVAFFSQPPRWWERRDNAGRWILETQRQLQTALYRWAEALGATRLKQTDPPAYKGTPVTTPSAEEAIAALRAVVQERMVYLLGIFKAHHAEKLDALATELKTSLSTMIAVVPAPDEKGWSGLNEDGALAFSLAAYEENEERHNGAIILAEGIALLVKQTTAVGDLQHALSAPPELVERALTFQGVDLDTLVREVSALEKRRMHMLLERVDVLLAALKIGDSDVSPPCKLAILPNDHWGSAIQQLKSLEGELADQVLSAMTEVAPDLSRAASAELLRVILDEARFEQGTLAVTRALLTALRETGWTLDRRVYFAERYLGEDSPDLYKRQPVCAQLLNRAIITALIDQLATGEWDHSTLQLDMELDVRARTLLDTLRPISPLETAGKFNTRLHTVLKISLLVRETSLLLLEFPKEVWERLSQEIQENTADALAQLPQPYQTLFVRCLQEGTLQPLAEQRVQHVSTRQHRIQILEHRLAKGDLAFEVANLIGPANLSAFNTDLLSAVVNEPGQSSGGGGLTAVTEDQALRGRVAELFALEVCWQRYLHAGRSVRERVLTAIARHREHGAGGVPWSTKTAWKHLQPRLKAHWEDMLTCTIESALSEDGELRELFKDLIEVANERGPGFDVLDPFGMWGQADISAPNPARVEVKAILPPDAGARGHRVMLSTHEFHRARQHPESYILRLIYVPREYEDVHNVRWAIDIPAPVQTLHLDEKLVLGVRSGTLPFVVHME